MHKQRQRALKMTKFVISFAFFVFILGKGLPEKLHFRGKGTLLHVINERIICDLNC